MISLALRNRLGILPTLLALVYWGTLAGTACADQARQLTTAPGDDDEPCFSPDGTWIVYQSRDASGKPDLWVVGAEGGEPQRITAGPGYHCFPTWSPDGRRIEYASDPKGEYDLYAIDREVDGAWSAPKQLTHTPRVREYVPAFSPDGNEIAFSAALPTGYRLGDNGVFIMNAAGEEPGRRTGKGLEGASFHFDVVGRQLVSSPHGAVEPSWSRDGKSISYTWSYIWPGDGGHQMGVSLIAADASTIEAGQKQQLRQLQGYASYGAAFSPTADVLAFVMARDQPWDIWLLAKPYTGDPACLTDSPANDVNPAWSPDGRRIAFASNRQGNYDVYLIDVPETLASAEKVRESESKVRDSLDLAQLRSPAHGRQPEGPATASKPFGDPLTLSFPRPLPRLHARLAGWQIEGQPAGVVQRNWQRVLKTGEASEDPNDLSRWTVTACPPEVKGLGIEPASVICADKDHGPVEFIHDPNLDGWQRVLIGLYLPPGITYTGVAAKLSGEEAFTCVADPRASLPDRGKGRERFLDADFVEVFFTEADLTGRKIVVHHPEGCRSYVTHFRFIPMTEAQVNAAKARRAKEPFDVHLWLDVLDYAGLAERPQDDWWQNSPRAMHRIARYFCDYGGNCLGYRVMAGGRARYNSKVLQGERQRYIDKRIGMDLRDPWGKYRYGDIEVDLLDEWVKAAHFYDKKAFAVWCLEESHGYPVFLDSFNVEHPHLMSRHKDGTYQLACASFADPEVIRYKMSIAEELIGRGIDGFVFDFQRIWGWYQKRDMCNHHRGLGGWNKGFDPRAVEAYRKKYGVDPRSEPGNNQRWIKFWVEYRTGFFRELKALVDKSGREVEIVVTVPAVSKDPFTSIRAYGCDWETLVDEGLITALSPMIPPQGSDGHSQTIDDLIDVMEYVHAKCEDKCDVVWPLTYYKRSLVGLANNSKIGVPDFTSRIMEAARAHGGIGVNLTTVDFNMDDAKRQLHIDTVMRIRDAMARDGPRKP